MRDSSVCVTNDLALPVFYNQENGFKTRVRRREGGRERERERERLPLHISYKSICIQIKFYKLHCDVSVVYSKKRSIQ